MRGSHSLCVVISIDLSAVQQPFPADFLSFALPPFLTLYPLIVPPPPPPIRLCSVAAPQSSFNIVLCLVCLTDLLDIVALILLHTLVHIQQTDRRNNKFTFKLRPEYFIDQ